MGSSLRERRRKHGSEQASGCYSVHVHVHCAFMCMYAVPECRHSVHIQGEGKLTLANGTVLPLSFVARNSPQQKVDTKEASTMHHMYSTCT